MSSTSRRSFILAAALLACGITKASDKDEARAVVDKARIALGDVLRTKEYDSLRAGLKQAKGILIFPSVLKAGIFLGCSGGTGVLLVRGQNNEWSHPAFYTVGAVSFGVQFGGQESATVILINHQKAVDGLMANSVKLVGDASVAVGPAGAGQAANVTADFVSYSKAKGAFMGMSVEGSVLDVRATLNQAYYGKAATPIDIVGKRSVSSAHAAGLRKALAAASK